MANLLNMTEAEMYAFVENMANKFNLKETLIALPYAQQKHKGQERDGTGEPYFTHPLAVASHLLCLGVYDDKVIAAAILHDVCEDCDVSIEALPVCEHTRYIIKLLTYKPTDDLNEVDNRVKYFNAICSDKSAILVKAADRCHNISCMSGVFSVERFVNYINDTENFVIPMLTRAKERFPEIRRQLLAIEYHIASVLKAV